MPITADELNRIADAAFAAGKALEAAEERAKNDGQTDLADQCSSMRERLDNVIRRFWNENCGVFLNRLEMAAISQDLGAAATAIKQAATNLAGLKNALRSLSGAIERILNVIRLVKAF
jgi:hypothetical protein